MTKIKGWRKLRASDNNFMSWVANEGQNNETILSLLKNQGVVKVVRKIPGSVKGIVLEDHKFNIPERSYDYAIAYMKSYPFGYREAMIGK